MEEFNLMVKTSNIPIVWLKNLIEEYQQLSYIFTYKEIRNAVCKRSKCRNNGKNHAFFLQDSIDIIFRWFYMSENLDYQNSILELSFPILCSLHEIFSLLIKDHFFVFDNHPSISQFRLLIQSQDNIFCKETASFWFNVAAIITCQDLIEIPPILTSQLIQLAIICDNYKAFQFLLQQKDESVKFEQLLIASFLMFPFDTRYFYDVFTTFHPVAQLTAATQVLLRLSNAHPVAINLAISQDKWIALAFYLLEKLDGISEHSLRPLLSQLYYIPLWRTTIVSHIHKQPWFIPWDASDIAFRIQWGYTNFDEMEAYQQYPVAITMNVVEKLKQVTFNCNLLVACLNRLPAEAPLPEKREIVKQLMKKSHNSNVTTIEDFAYINYSLLRFCLPYFCFQDIDTNKIDLLKFVLVEKVTASGDYFKQDCSKLSYDIDYYCLSCLQTGLMINFSLDPTIQSTVTDVKLLSAACNSTLSDMPCDVISIVLHYVCYPSFSEGQQFIDSLIKFSQ